MDEIGSINNFSVTTLYDEIGFTDNGTNYTTDIPLTTGKRSPLLLIAGICCAIFIFLGVPGNLFTVIALLRTRKLRNATTAFIVNLCVADGSFCVASLPLVASFFLRVKFVHSGPLCILYALFRYNNVAVSLLTVLAITVNRYVLICHPSKYRLIYTKCNMAVMITSIWLVSLLFLVPTLFDVWGRFGFDAALGSCSINKYNGKSYKTFLYVMCFVLPVVMFLTCYARIFYVVWRSAKKFRNSAARNQSSPVSVVPKNKDLRLLKILAVIYGTLVICFLPVVLVKIFMKEDNLQAFTVLGYLGVSATSCLNPFIYVVMSKEYRRAYASLFTCSKNN